MPTKTTKADQASTPHNRVATLPVLDVTIGQKLTSYAILLIMDHRGRTCDAYMIPCERIAFVCVRTWEPKCATHVRCDESDR